MLRDICERYGVEYVDVDLGKIAVMSYGSVVVTNFEVPPNPYFIRDGLTYKWVSLEFRDFFAAKQALNHPNILLMFLEHPHKYKRALETCKILDYETLQTYFVRPILDEFSEYCSKTYLDIQEEEALIRIRQGLMFNFKYFRVNGDICTYRKSQWAERLETLHMFCPELFVDVSASGFLDSSVVVNVTDESDNVANSRELFTVVNDLIASWSGINYILDYRVL